MTGKVGFPENAKSYSGEVTADLVGPLSLGAGFGITKIDDVDENVTTFGGQAAYEVSGTSFSACPVVGAEYSTWSDTFSGVDVDVNQLVIPVGVGIGTTLAAGSNTDVVLFAVPQFLHIRSSVEASEGNVSFEDSDSDNEFGAEAGARFVFGSIFAGAGVFMTSIEDDDPTFNLAVGLTFGGR
ncbi:MAG: hypothetical protein WEA24_11845 [Gemmatimonadota bacterium]